MGRRTTLLLLLLAAGVSQANAHDPAFGGQVRPRFEFRDPAFGGGDDDSFTSMRARIHVRAQLERQVGVYVELQDVRLWGEELNTLGDFQADNFDLHQGYVDFRQIGGKRLDLRLGRQEISLGGQRLVGAVGWTQQGRSFDGARLTLRPKETKVDLLWIRLADSTAPGVTRNGYLVGAYGQLHELDDVELFAFYNSQGSATDQFTFGLRESGEVAGLTYRMEGAYQIGDRGDLDVAAYMVGVRVGKTLSDGRSKVTLWYDRLSGDDDPTDGDIEVFDTLFATNHKFYGFADYFLNIPLHTQGLGLQDLALKLVHSRTKTFSLGLDVHRFLLTEKGPLDDTHLGDEIDLTVKYRYSADATFVGGISYIVADDAFEDIGRLDEDAVWAYIMTNVTF